MACILGDSEDAGTPNGMNNQYIYPPVSHVNTKAKLKSERIDAYIEKQACEQGNVVKILLLGIY